MLFGKKHQERVNTALELQKARSDAAQAEEKTAQLMREFMEDFKKKHKKMRLRDV